MAEASRLTGWGRTTVSMSEVLAARSVDEAREAITSAGERGVIARGLGRAYGDAAQNSGGAVIDATRMEGTVEIDEVRGVATAPAGVSLAHLAATLVPRGWFLPVVPGTKHVTVGGAIASDIHGKNHHADGNLSNHVLSLTLLTSSGDLVTCSRDENAGVFWTTCGGMGLTGVITHASIALTPIPSGLLSVDTERCDDLDGLLARMSEGDATYRYSVAWVDGLARGRSFGRGVLSRADHADVEGDAPAPATKARLRVPFTAPPGTMNRATVRAFNALWFAKAPRREKEQLQAFDPFFFPLDAVSDWNRLYPRGFLQYQVALPYGEERVLQDVLEKLAACALPTLVVLKQFGPGTPSPLSFPLAGWTLAVDVPLGPSHLARALDSLDEKVAGAGGRVYLTKDARMRPEAVRAMYPRLDDWCAARAKLDPAGTMRSDLARRLELIS